MTHAVRTAGHVCSRAATAPLYTFQQCFTPPESWAGSQQRGGHLCLSRSSSAACWILSKETELPKQKSPRWKSCVLTSELI